MKTLWFHGRLLTMAGGQYQPVLNASMITDAGKIVWMGDSVACPVEIESARRNNAEWKVVDLNKAWVTPGFVDCHTHLVFGGERSKEFEMRLQGKSYADIAAAGGGIVSTVTATRQSSDEALYSQARLRLQHLMDDGVTTIEIKTGYGLDLDSELKMLRVIHQLRKHMSIQIKVTALLAHALPVEYLGRQQAYVDYLCSDVLPAMAAVGGIDAVDAFCEYLAFTPAQIAQLFDVAKGLALPVKLHAEQLSHFGGTQVAARYRALSADHLEYINETDVQSLKAANTVAVLLPGAFYLLHEKQRPAIELLRKHQVPMAISTDCNPGTSPVLSLRLMANMACTLFGLTVEEALAGITIQAARALGCADQCGSLEIGKDADFLIWQINEPAELVYWLGGNLPHETVYQGEKR
jgi:imidazolonepropionase